MAKVVQYILDIESGKAKKGLKDVSKQSKRAENQLDRTRKSGMKMTSALAVGAAASVAAIGTLFYAIKEAAVAASELTKEVVDSVNNLNDLSAKSGVAAGTIQALSTAFGASGQEASKAEAFISKMPKVYADLATEGSRASKAADQLGISIRNQDGSMKSADALLVDMTKSLQAVEDDTERASAAFQLFGRSAGDFLQAFGKTASMESFLRLTEKFGVQVGEKASKAAADYQLQLSVLDTVAAGLKQSFVEAAGGVNFFNNFMKNAIVITVGLQEMISNNNDAFQEFGQGMANLASGFFGVLQAMMSEFGSVINAATSMIAKNILTIATILHQLGAIADETFASAVQMSAGLMQVGVSSEKIGAELETTDFGNTKSGAEAVADLEVIMAGLDDQMKGTSFSFDEFNKVVKDTEKNIDSATESMERSAEGKAFDKQLESVERFIASTEGEFAKLGKTSDELKAMDLQSTIAQLEEAISFLDEFGLNTDMQQAIGLRIEAENQLEQVLDDIANSSKAATTSLEMFELSISDIINTAASAISSLESPEGILRNMGSMLESLAPLLEAGSAAAGNAASSLVDVALGDGSKLVTGLAAKGAGAASAAGTAAAGAAASAAAAAPIVGALGAIAVALANLGKQTTEDINQKFDDFVVNFEKGIDLLPEILTKVLPEFIAQITKIFLVDMQKLLMVDLPIALIQAMFLLIPELIKELVLLVADIFHGIVRAVEGIRVFIETISTKEGWKRVGDSISQAIKDQLTQSKEFLVEAFSMRSGGRFIPEARGGIRFTGADEGLAMLHRGEFVVPESNVMPQAVDRRLKSEMGGGINLTINADIIEGSAVDSLVRKIEERFGSLGASTSTLFGGI